MIATRWLLQNEGTKTAEFRETLKTALIERTNDPRRQSKIRYERLDAETALATVREIAARNDVHL